MQNQDQGFQFYTGPKCTFVTPSSNTVTIREQNGDDDEILSLVDKDKGAETVSNLNAFLSRIIEDNTYNNSKSLTQEEVSKIKLKDKYYILLKSRLHSIGSDIRFKATCPKKSCKHVTTFKEDLTQYDTDLSKFKEAKERYKYQITPHLGGKLPNTEFTLTSGKRIEYTYLNVAGELEMSKLETISENTEFYVRELKMFNPAAGKYEKLSSFNVFGKKDMIEISKHIFDNDQQFMMFMELQCEKCKTEWEIPFLYLKDFFFPGEI